MASDCHVIMFLGVCEKLQVVSHNLVTLFQAQIFHDFILLYNSVYQYLCKLRVVSHNPVPFFFCKLIICQNLMLYHLLLSLGATALTKMYEAGDVGVVLPSDIFLVSTGSADCLTRTTLVFISLTLMN